MSMKISIILTSFDISYIQVCKKKNLTIAKESKS